MKIAKETFLVKISDILKLRDFHFCKAGQTGIVRCAVKNVIFTYELTPAQTFYFVQKGSSNKCAIFYVELASSEDFSPVIRANFLTEDEFDNFFHRGGYCDK